MSSGTNQQTPSPTPGNDARAVAHSRQHARRSVIFTPALQIHRYPPAVWGDDEEVDDDDEWDVGGYEDEDPSLAEEAALELQERRAGGAGDSDDGMSWEEALPDPRAHVSTAAEEQRRQQEFRAQQLQQQTQQQLLQQQQAEQQAAQLQQQQRQQIEEQRRQQQLIAQTMARQANTTPTQGLGGTSIQTSDSRDQLIPSQDTSASVSSSSISTRSMDPMDAVETKKITMTPLVAQDNSQLSQPPRQAPPRSGGPMLPSQVMQRQEEERKRTREEIGALEEAARKKTKSPSGGRPNGSPAKLRKEPQSGDEDSGREKDKKGKTGGLFGRLFDRRKDKHKEKGSNDSLDIGRSIDTRSSEDSGRSSNQTDNSSRPQTPPRRGMAPATTTSPVSQHATSLRQRDREQQALYQQQYLTRSPASPPEVQSPFQMSPGSPGQGVVALGGASATLSPSTDGRRPRPGSLVLGGNISGDGSGAVPELSVIRVFAGKKLQTEATFKTVLLNSSTTSEELVKQAIQRFRLPAGEDSTDYYLTVKRLEGSSAELRLDEKPLVVFETLAEAALDLPKVKRSSVGSISSIASNLSQHPAIKRLPMNDFTDDSAVKIYLNRHSESASDESTTTEEGDVVLNTGSGKDNGENGGGLRLRTQHLNITGTAVSSERFSSPSFRFALQLLIYPDDLPDDMVFDPLTEAIVFKHTLRDRPQAVTTSAPFRRKVFVFPKNITVAEVIEIGLERFGIPDGVVDGGDEVEDKNTKRRSSSRVRYVLNVLVDGKGRWRLFF
jgi:Ras association (RalGDS/AF-6) domain